MNPRIASFLSAVLLLLAALGTTALRRPECPPMRNLVASGRSGLGEIPEAEMVLVRSPWELQAAIKEREARQGNLILMADLETGPGLIFGFGERFQPPGALAAAGDPDLVAAVGQYYGQAFALAGFDIVTAPVADLYKGSSAVGWRTMGSTLETALPRLEIMVKALAKGGALPVIKHYPGHGGASGDTHHSLATIEIPWEEFQREDLEVFRRLCQLDETAGVMLGHLRGSRNPALGWPADAVGLTMTSPFWMNVLRNEWNFNGLLVSDALGMRAAIAVMGGEAFVASRFIDLDGDLLLGMNHKTGAAQCGVRLHGCYHAKAMAESKSALRVTALKNRLLDQRVRNRQLNREEVLARGKRLATTLANKSLLAEGNWKRPLVTSSTPFYTAFEKGLPGSEAEYRAVVEKLGKPLGEYDFKTTGTPFLLVVYGLLSEPALTDAQMQVLAERAAEGQLLVVVVCGWPGLIYDLKSRGIPALATWGASDASMRAAAAWLEGTEAAQGRWPYADEWKKAATP